MRYPKDLHPIKSKYTPLFRSHIGVKINDKNISNSWYFDKMGVNTSGFWGGWPADYKQKRDLDSTVI